MHTYLDKAEQRMKSVHIHRSLIDMNIKPRQCTCESVIIQDDTELVINLFWQRMYLKSNITTGETWLSITPPPTFKYNYIRTLTYQSKPLSFRFAAKCEERFFSWPQRHHIRRLQRTFTQYISYICWLQWAYKITRKGSRYIYHHQ